MKGSNGLKLLAVTTAGLWLLLGKQAMAVGHEPGVWAIFSTTDGFRSGVEASRWHYWFDAQARYADLGSGTNQWLVRPAIGYEFKNGTKAWVGYARFRSRNSNGVVADENRYWQQVDQSFSSWQSGRLTLRTRLEQRLVSVGDDTAVVLRLMAKYTRPVGAGTANIVIGIEPFFDLKSTDWDGDAGLGQNRLFVGASTRLGARTTLEAGYMNQYIWRERAENRANHLGILNFRVKL